MDEIIDLLDEFGNKKNMPISKKEAHQKGLWHQAIHILIINKDKTKTLIQQRCSQKNFYPNMWDISVGGHVSFNEDTLTSAKRELQEETGLVSHDMTYLGETGLAVAYTSEIIYLYYIFIKYLTHLKIIF